MEEDDDGSGHPDVKARNLELDARGAGGRGGVDDLIHLTHLHEPAILHVLETRYRNDAIYTYTGPILLAVNPFQRLPIYEQETLQEYYTTGLLKAQGVETPPLPPHVFATADTAFRCMMNTDSTPAAGAESESRNQTLLVSGESGAGKTETTKIIMQYLATVGRPRGGLPSSRDIAARVAPHLGDIASDSPTSSPRSGSGSPSAVTSEESASVEHRVLESNPILEAFGNSKTLRNDNSSRFGKFIELQFNRRGELVGARIETYLLEKVRVVTQCKGERSFHAFYLLTAGMSDKERADLGIKSPQEHEFLRYSECYSIRDAPEDESLERTRQAMRTIGFSFSEEGSIWRILAGLLLMGDLRFVEGSETDSSRIDPDSQATATKIGELLGISADRLEWALTGKHIKAGTEVFRTLFTPDQASAASEALAKNVYGHLFQWIVSRVNDRIRAPEGAPSMFIGVLDIFGFEHFEQNSFEQLCINYANETLQQQFNQFVFKLEQEEYAREGIEWSEIDFPDNQDCLDLIEGKRPPGILALLDEQCMLGARASEKGFANQMQEQLKDHARFHTTPRMLANEEFVVRHYAGNVKYSIEGFLDKNRDQIHAEATEVVRESWGELMQQLYAKERAEAAGEGSESGSARGGGSSEAAGGKGKKKRKRDLMNRTVGSQFKAQLSSLLKVIRATTPHYVRCLKPNAAGEPRTFERKSIVSQLRCGGVLEAVRVARLGFPVRLPHAEFIRSYQILLSHEQRSRLVGVDGPVSPRHIPRRPSIVERDPAVAALVGKVRGQVKELLSLLDPPLPDKSVQAGTTKVFFRRSSFEEIEKRRQNVLRDATVRVQATVRMHHAVKRWQAVRRAVLRMQATARGYLARKFVTHLRRDLAAKALAAFFAMSMRRAAFVRYRRAVVRLQAQFQGTKARVLFRELRRQRAATKLQSFRRSQVKRATFLQWRRAAVKVQCAIRCALARRRLLKLRKKAREVGSLREQLNDLRAEVRFLRQDRDMWKEKAEALMGGAQPSLDEDQENIPQPPSSADGDAETGAGTGAAASAGAEGEEEFQEETGPKAAGEAVQATEGTADTAATPPASAEDREELLRRLRNEARREVQSELKAARARESQLADLRASLEASERRALAAEQRVEELQQTIQEQSASSSTTTFVRRIQERMEAQLQRAKREAEASERRARQAEHARSEALREREQTQAAAEELAGENVRLKQEVDQSRHDTVNAYQRQVDQLTERVSESEREADRYRNEFESLRRAMTEQGIEKDQMISRLEAQLTDIKDEIDAFRENKRYDRSAKMALAQRLETAIQERNDAMGRAESLAREVARLRQQLESHSSQVDRATTSLGSPSPLPGHGASRDRGQQQDGVRRGPPSERGQVRKNEDRQPESSESSSPSGSAGGRSDGGGGSFRTAVASFFKS